MAKSDKSRASGTGSPSGIQRQDTSLRSIARHASYLLAYLGVTLYAGSFLYLKQYYATLLPGQPAAYPFLETISATMTSPTLWVTALSIGLVIAVGLESRERAVSLEAPLSTGVVLMFGLGTCLAGYASQLVISRRTPISGWVTGSIIVSLVVVATFASLSLGKRRLPPGSTLIYALVILAFALWVVLRLLGYAQGQFELLNTLHPRGVVSVIGEDVSYSGVLVPSATGNGVYVITSVSPTTVVSTFVPASETVSISAAR